MMNQDARLRKGICIIVSHDAGGAEIISSLIRAQKLQCVYALQGPAIKVFERKFGRVENLSLEDAISRGDWLLCGTSWQSDLEYEATKLVRAQSKYSVAFLDHWVNYRARFEKNQQLILPDEIWLGDDFAMEIALREFKSENIILSIFPNPYFKEIVREGLGNTRRKSTKQKYLYICEPISEHMKIAYGNELHKGFTEYDLMRDFLGDIKKIDKEILVHIRLHPSESRGKYDQLVAGVGLNVTFGQEIPLIEEINDADIVVGWCSMALVVAKLLNKKVEFMDSKTEEVCILKRVCEKLLSMSYK